MNLNPGNSSAGVDIDRSMLKIIGLAFSGVFFSFGFGLFLKLLFGKGDFIFFFFTLAAATFFLTVFFLQALFIKQFRTLALILMAECLGLVAGFYDKILMPAVWGSVAFAFLAMLLANYNARKEINNALKMSFRKIGRTVLPKAIASLALFSSVVYVATMEGDALISRIGFERMMMPSFTLVQKFYPEFDFSLTLNEFFAFLAGESASKIPQFEILPKSVKAQLINQSAKEFQGRFEEFMGPVNSKLKITDAIYESLMGKFRQANEKTQSLVLMGIAFFIFLFLESLARPFRLMITFLTYIIYEILLALGFAKVELEGTNREIIILK